MKGILFKPEMIQAIVEGRKTQTRRVIKAVAFGQDWLRMQDRLIYRMPEHDYALIRLYTRYQVGETVYIKERLQKIGEHGIYFSDAKPVWFLGSANRLVWRWQKRWLSPLHCPHEAARHFIKITNVKVQRLQEITEEDAKAEGTIIPERAYFGCLGETPTRDAYFFLWNSINPKYPWESNPLVFMYEFKRTSQLARDYIGK